MAYEICRPHLSKPEQDSRIRSSIVKELLKVSFHAPHLLELKSHLINRIFLVLVCRGATVSFDL
jgi:hypothetical protein